MHIGRSRLDAACAAVIVTLGLGACDIYGGKSTDELIEIVRTETADAEDRCRAAVELGDRKEEVSGLKAVMKSYSRPDAEEFQSGQWPVAGCVARALGQIGDPSAVKPMLEAWAVFEDEGANSNKYLFDEVARDAIAAMGAPAVPKLTAILKKWNVRLKEDPAAEYSNSYCNAGEALGRIGDPQTEPLLVDALANDCGRGVGEGVALMYRDDVDHLLPLLKSEETVDIAYGILGLGKPGTEPALRKALMRFGDEALALEYLNCGNTELEAAAGEWAATNGYFVTAQPGSATASWGSLK